MSCSEVISVALSTCIMWHIQELLRSLTALCAITLVSYWF